MKKQKLLFLSLLLVGMGLWANSLMAALIVNYTVSGNPGDWSLNFSVTNHLGIPNLDIYCFGVALPNDSITGSPENWATHGPYANEHLNWVNLANIQDMIQNGETMSGFQVNVTSLKAPNSVGWEAGLYDFTNAGEATYNGDPNPVFRGTTTQVPLPSTLLFLGPCLAGLMFVKRKLRSDQ